MMSRQAIEALLPCIREAGQEIMRFHGGDFEISYKEDKSPVTQADEASHEIIAAYLHKQHSDVPLLSEEGEIPDYGDRKSWKYLWLLDPLDGTKSFVSGSESFSINLALVQENKAILGLIYLPAQEVLYLGVKGEGCFQVLADNSWQPLGGKRDRPENEVIILGSRLHGSDKFNAFVREKEADYGQVTVITKGSALKFCALADGKGDMYPRFSPTMEWDTAAGQVIVEEAGFKVLKYPEMIPLTYNKASLLNPHFICQ